MPIVKVNSRNRMTAVPAKVNPTFKLIVIIFTFLFWSNVILAQKPSSTPLPPPLPRPVDGQARPSEDRPLTTFEEEIRAKREIKLAEKDHKANLDRAREIAEIGKELRENLRDKSTLDRASVKKIERLEKLTRKVRGEAGGEDEEVDIINRPTDIPSAAAQVADASESLSKDVLNTPRQVVSTAVISNANVLLELIKMLRGFDRRH